MGRLGFALMLGVLLLAVAPAAASGATFFVDGQVSEGNCSEALPCRTIGEAVGASRVDADPDTIKIAPGLYPERVELMDPNDSGLTIEGSGSGSDPATNTIIQDGGPATYIVLVLGAPEGPQTEMTARNLRLVNTTNEERGSAAILNASSAVLEDVYATVAAPADDPVLHVREDDARLERVTAKAVGGPGVTRASGVYADGNSLIVRDSDILGDEGGGLEVRSDGDLQLVRSRVTATPGAEYALRTQGTMTADSSLLSGGVIGLLYFGGDPASPNRDANLRGVTIDAGQPGVVDPVVSSDDEESGYAIRLVRDEVNVRLDSSIALERSASFGGEVRCSFSNVPDQQEAANPVDGTGPISCGHTAGSGNFSSPPFDLFENAAGGDYRLKPGSPAFDRGSPRALEPGESALDLARASRVASGPECPPRRDQGAYELQVSSCLTPPLLTTPPDLIAPKVTGAGLTRRLFRVGSRATPLASTSRRRAPAGTTIRLTLSEAAKARIAVERGRPGRRVGRRCRPPTRGLRGRRACVRWNRAGALTRNLAAGRARVPFSGRLGRRPLRPGRYRLSITARDAAGNSSPKPVRLAFRVVRR